MKLKTFLFGAGLAVLLQSLALGSMIFDRYQKLQNGTEVMLRSGMIDPRDFFRGHYVVLNLESGNITDEMVKFEKEPERNAAIYVELAVAENGFWQAKALYVKKPDKTNGPIMRAKYWRKTAQGHEVSLPYTRFYAHKDRAKALENIRNKQQLGVIIALDKNGEGLIKGLVLDGKRIYNEPLF